MAAFTETKTLSGIDCVIDYAHENDLRVSDEELQRYVDRDHQLNPYKTLQWMKLEVDGEDVGIHYGYQRVPFDRIRRITGYLVGTMDRWNDAKTAEEHDRVKHGVCHRAHH